MKHYWHNEPAPTRSQARDVLWQWSDYLGVSFTRRGEVEVGRSTFTIWAGASLFLAYLAFYIREVIRTRPTTSACR
jgi:hypothetical protein